MSETRPVASVSGLPPAGWLPERHLPSGSQAASRLRSEPLPSPGLTCPQLYVFSAISRMGLEATVGECPGLACLSHTFLTRQLGELKWK